MSAACPSCGIAVSCAAHEADLAMAIHKIGALEREVIEKMDAAAVHYGDVIRSLEQTIDALERHLGVVQLERAEKTRMWDAARKEVERLSTKLMEMRSGRL